MAARPPEPEYPGHAEVWRVPTAGRSSSTGETIACEEVADGVWALLVYGVELGRFEERDCQLKTRLPPDRVTHVTGRYMPNPILVSG